MLNFKNLLLRKRLIVDPHFQNDAALFFLLVMFSGILLFFTFCVFFGYQFIENISLVNPDLAEQILNSLSQSQKFLIYLSIAIITITGLTTIVFSLYFTNRISGPLYRIDTDLKKMMTDNDFKKIKIRDSDFCKSHLEVINQLIEKHLHKTK